MTAEDVRVALRERYSATISFNGGHAPDAWTTICEWMNIDLLALSAWRTPPNGRTGVSYPIIGHEIKISRADYRRELRSPHKRASAVGFCTQFYFVVPDGLLKPDEIAWQPPAWILDHKAWQRVPCPASAGLRYGACYRGKRTMQVEGPLQRHVTWRDTVEIPCDTCRGRGYIERSRVEREAPTLWVPADVGLMTITGSRVKVVRKAAVRPNAPSRQHPLGMVEDSRERTRAALGDLVRWVSVRPDPRHVLVKGQL